MVESQCGGGCGTTDSHMLRCSGTAVHDAYCRRESLHQREVPSLTLEQEMIMTDATGFLRDPSSPIQDADGVWHAWVVWVDPVYGGDLLHSPHSPTRTPTPTLSFHSDPSCSTIVWV
eukprot:m.89422 g.89422  ORF g.89422 m.89422 type:complete len:117 (+) comp20059_c0_seq2:117-467(+)